MAIESTTFILCPELEGKLIVTIVARTAVTGDLIDEGGLIPGCYIYNKAVWHISNLIILVVYSFNRFWELSLPFYNW